MRSHKSSKPDLWWAVFIKQRAFALDEESRVNAGTPITFDDIPEADRDGIRAIIFALLFAFGGNNPIELKRRKP